MQTRKIIYASMQGNNGSQTVYSSAATWGELKQQQTDIAAKSMGMKALIREGKIELTNDQQALPEGDFNLYLILEKNNSGISDVAALIDAFIAEELAVQSVPF